MQAEVIDPRTLRPLDLDTILALGEEDQPLRRRRGGLAARRRRREPGGADRRARLRRPRRAGARVSGADVPMPYSKPLEDIAFPHEPQIVQAALADPRARRGEGRVMAEIVMPRLSDTMEEGTILAGSSADGEHVARGRSSSRSRPTRRDDLRVRPGWCPRDVAGEGDTLAVGAAIAQVGRRRQRRAAARRTASDETWARPRRRQRRPSPTAPTPASLRLEFAEAQGGETRG